jgi:long-subunit acyl-CoA synthetase (AMP-forming)
MTAVAQQTTTKVVTVASRVRDRALQMPSQIALREKDFGIWQEVSWADYWNYAELVGHALLALGIDPGDRIAVHSENRREWLYSDIGTIAVRATTVGLYPTNPPAEVAYLLSHSGARVLIAEDQEQVDKALEVLDELPELEKIIYLEPRGIRYRYTDQKLMSWDDFLALGARHRESDPDAVRRRMTEATDDDVMTMVYTSGTTGPPKGAMLAVANVEYCMKVLIEGGGFTTPPPLTVGCHALLPSAMPHRRADFHHLVLGERGNPGAFRRVDRNRAGQSARGAAHDSLWGAAYLGEGAGGGSDQDRSGNLAQAHVRPVLARRCR